MSKLNAQYESQDTERNLYFILTTNNYNLYLKMYIINTKMINNISLNANLN